MTPSLVNSLFVAPKSEKSSLFDNYVTKSKNEQLITSNCNLKNVKKI
jgi:hypothetical protein